MSYIYIVMICSGLAFKSARYVTHRAKSHERETGGS